MRTIYKYRLGLTDDSLQMPIGAEILCVQTQQGEITIWALVDTNAASETRRFAIHGTGFSVPNDGRLYLGTVQIAPFVWHIFEVA
jgi:hypothetical protein